MINPLQQNMISRLTRRIFPEKCGPFLISAVCMISLTSLAVSQTTHGLGPTIYARASVGLLNTYTTQEPSEKLSEKSGRQTVQISIVRDRKTGLLYATIDGRKLQARKLSYLEKEAQKAYPDKTIQLVDADSGHIFTMPRTMLGVILQPVSGVTASQLNIKDGQAIVIDECFPGLPADRAHLRKYDIILSCDGKRPISKRDFTQILNCAEPGDRLNLIVLRNGQEVEIEVPLTAYDPVVARRLNNSDYSAKSGMRFDPLSGASSAQNSSSNNAGQHSMRSNMDRLMIQLQDQGQLLPMEMAGNTPSASYALMGARTSEIEGRLMRLQDQLDRIEQLLGMMLQDQYGGNHQSRTKPPNDAQNGHSPK